MATSMDEMDAAAVLYPCTEITLKSTAPSNRRQNDVGRMDHSLLIGQIASVILSGQLSAFCIQNLVLPSSFILITKIKSLTD